MLKRLELVGFKSFADKTAFDFPAGITGIVGPNGSGKSNVVDAVRWVLGEQSARSLRGGEMTDVIFNGSASRRSLGLAEVIMTFDNSRRCLATEAEEVQIGRRVYRSGESEYLINQQVCRLKDIKDLFLGSGAGTDAYSIIEQGRVDALLQASTKDRRTIFEEAAGISRFRVKKTETLRRLERVEQNLQRLRDILEEVEKQLRSVKLQAAKAQRYQEYTERLRQLRVAVGLRDYGQLADRLGGETAALGALRSALEESLGVADASERELHALEQTLGRLEEQMREQEGSLAAAAQQIAAEEATLAHEWSLSQSLEQDLAQTRQQLAQLSVQTASLGQSARQAAEEVAQAEGLLQVQRREVQQLLAEARGAEEQLTELTEQVVEYKHDHMEAMRQAARLQNDAVSYRAQVDNLTRERDRLLHRSEQAAEHLASVDVELEELVSAEGALQERMSSVRQGLTDLRQQRDQLRQAQDEATQKAADLGARRSGLASRVEVLEGLERTHEGLGAGIREVFAHLEEESPGAWSTVLGLVADFLTVRREYAPLIDLALGDHAHRFLVADRDLLEEALDERGQPFSSRVSFLPVRSFSHREVPGGKEPEPAGPLPLGAVALASSLARCDDPRLTGLAEHLLGRTLIVEDLESARRLAGQLPGYRFATLQGELLEADGTLTVGTHHAEAGILSRKSELRELREQAAGLEVELRRLEQELAGLRERAAGVDGRIENQRVEIDVLNEQLTDLRTRVGQHRQRREGLHEEVVISKTEIDGLEQEITKLRQAWEEAVRRAAEAEASVQALQASMEEAEREIRERESQRQRLQQQTLAEKVALAQAEERLEALRQKQQQLDGDLKRRAHDQEGAEQHLAQTRARWQESQLALLGAYSALASCHARKGEAERLLAGWGLAREQQRERRQVLLEQSQSSRSSWRTLQEQAHARELEVNSLTHQVDTLLARLQEDYQIDLRSLYTELRARHPEASGEELARAGLQGPDGAGQIAELPGDPVEEINELKKKLSRLGSVSLDALQELADLESRARALHIQHDDLTAAEKTLQEIIAKINVDSRRMFQETFTTIRTHFQELFRKLFGGGQADIVLEDENDILESGIEVIARPPGKELRSISLMSGGEKTMTAVALLLAIFRSKPSPFCILDEVDAALDEANIGRFTAVLHEFLDQSQFIIITHSRRTMACADVLYGVTMQESGISRRISVRFEDWADEEQQAPDQGSAEAA